MKTITRRITTPGRGVRRATRVSLPLEIKSILVPVDFSTPSKKALEYANALARLFKAKLTVMHVVEPVAMRDFATSFPLALENDELVAAAKKHLATLTREGRTPAGLVEKILVRSGSAYNEIANVARTRKADLIVIATHGYTGLKHALLGSTTERVVRHAPCPVLVVRQR